MPLQMLQYLKEQKWMSTLKLKHNGCDASLNLSIFQFTHTWGTNQKTAAEFDISEKTGTCQRIIINALKGIL